MPSRESGNRGRVGPCNRASEPLGAESDSNLGGFRGPTSFEEFSRGLSETALSRQVLGNSRNQLKGVFLELILEVVFNIGAQSKLVNKYLSVIGRFGVDAPGEGRSGWTERFGAGRVLIV
jgi:hypothetical protein